MIDFKTNTMNKILIAAQRCVVIICLLCSVFIATSRDEVTPLIALTTEEDHNVLDRLNNLESIVDIKYSKEVKSRIKNYVQTYPRGSEIILGRASIYFPIIENKIRERNLPEDLKFLAVVESALKADALSKSRATGLWQFVKGTGRMYGLEISRTVDERKDPIKSTEAALDYLTDLHNNLGDWTLALAAYNCGPGNMRKAIRKSGGKRNYWEIRKYLPQETQEYIPRLIAATYLMKYYYEYELQPDLPNQDYANTTSVKVFHKMSFNDIRNEVGISLEDLKFLNPSYLKNYIPESDGEHFLTLPELEMMTYLNRRGNHHDIVFSTSTRRSINKRESKRRTDRMIAALDALPSGNNGFAIPIEDRVFPLRTTLAHRSSGKKNDHYTYYKLGKRESLFELAGKLDHMNIDDLLALNDVDTTKPLVPGSVIKIIKN